MYFFKGQSKQEDNVTYHSGATLSATPFESGIIISSTTELHTCVLTLKGTDSHNNANQVYVGRWRPV